MKNPCIGCDNHGDYRDETCKDCGLRINYVRQIGGFPDAREITIMEGQETQATKDSGQSAPAPAKGMEKPAAPPKPTCNKDGCEKKVFARGMCAMHYNRWRKEKADKEAKKAPKSKAPKAAKTTPKKPKAAPAETSRPPAISVYENFADIDKLVADIRSIAAQEYRTPDAQMVYFLRRAVDGYYTENPKRS